MREYFAAKSGFICGAFRNVGDSVGEMTDAQAKYHLLGGDISEELPATREAASAKRRRKVKSQDTET